VARGLVLFLFDSSPWDLSKTSQHHPTLGLEEPNVRILEADKYGKILGGTMMEEMYTPATLWSQDPWMVCHGP